MTEKAVLLKVQNGVAAITLNRSSRGNAIDLVLARELAEVFAACESDRSLRVITLQGAGKLFCAGGDLAAIASATDPAAYVRALLSYLHQALLVIERVPVPVIAAIHGAAAGAGMSLACAADLAIATRSTRFVMAYPKVGLTPDGSASWYLPRLVGLRRALELSLLSDEISAEQAQAYGMLNTVVTDDALEASLANLADRLSATSGTALAGAKRLMRGAFDEPLDGQLEHEMETLCAALETKEARSAMAAFLARRPKK